jgi:hypothetical protein
LNEFAGGPLIDPLDTAAAGPAAVRGGALRIAGDIAGVSMRGVIAQAFLFRNPGLVRSGSTLKRSLPRRSPAVSATWV